MRGKVTMPKWRDPGRKVGETGSSTFRLAKWNGHLVKDDSSKRRPCNGGGEKEN